MTPRAVDKITYYSMDKEEVEDLLETAIRAKLTDLGHKDFGLTTRLEYSDFGITVYLTVKE